MTLFLLGLIASVPLGILANLLTLRVATALAERSARRRQARIERIRREAAEVTAYRDGSSNVMAARLTGHIAATVGAFAFAVIFNVVSLVTTAAPSHNASGYAIQVWAWVGIVSLTYAVYEALSTMYLCRNVFAPKWYEERTARELRKLGALPDRASAVAGADPGTG
jgi:hypothetical protein